MTTNDETQVPDVPEKKRVQVVVGGDNRKTGLAGLADSVAAAMATTKIDPVRGVNESVYSTGFTSVEIPRTPPPSKGRAPFAKFMGRDWRGRR